MGFGWLLWMVFILIFLVPPLGYGWGYRRWGPPYPRYIQRRRAALMGSSSTVNHQAWGWGGDLVWVVMVVAVFWVLVGLSWR